MMIPKNPRYRNKKLLQVSKDRGCIKCGAYDGTVVRAHYSGLGSHKLGKGTSLKCHDFASADLCHRCHTEIDQYEGGNDEARGYEFLMLCMQTLARDFEEGIIK